MITAGFDVGAKTIKGVLVRDKTILQRGKILAGFDAKGNTRKLFEELLAASDLVAADIEHIVATGSGRKEVSFSGHSVTDVTAAAVGAVNLHHSVRTVIDIGAEEGRCIRCDDRGKVIDFVVNEKCAAGAGAFTEAMARALEIPVEEFGTLSLKSTRTIPMNAQCAVFAESEVVSLLHARTPKEDIARAVNDAIASRISSMVRKVGFETDIMLIGGVAFNVGFVQALKNDLGTKIIVPEDPEYIGAFGAALYADEVRKG